ncbi:rCG36817 [Rattus norvegicus]|uniref:RCG36817 n=1 Tax=Rattus norvegicus TaxID=10116 RepID=A6HTP6_RAT|nr:rCG36817 [Rattus norvegicus]
MGAPVTHTIGISTWRAEKSKKSARGSHPQFPGTLLLQPLE